jgi:hypothetical protein
LATEGALDFFYTSKSAQEDIPEKPGYPVRVMEAYSVSALVASNSLLVSLSYA